MTQRFAWKVVSSLLLCLGAASLATEVRLVSVDGNGQVTAGVQHGVGPVGGVLSSPVGSGGDVIFSSMGTVASFPPRATYRPRRYLDGLGKSTAWYEYVSPVGGEDAVNGFAWAPGSDELYLSYWRSVTPFEALTDWATKGVTSWDGESGILAMAVSDDGQVGVFETSTGVYLRHLVSANPPLVPLAVGASGESKDVAISGDGRLVAFSSTSSSLEPGGVPDYNGERDIFLYEVGSGSIQRLLAWGSEPTAASGQPSLSASGRYLAFETRAGVYWGANDSVRTQIVWLDRETGEAMLCTRSLATGGAASGDSRDPRISADGRFVVYSSYAMDLVDGVPTDKEQIYLFDRVVARTYLVSRSNSGTLANRHCRVPGLSADGRFVTFASQANNLSGLALGSDQHVYRVDLGPLVGDASATVAAGGSVDLPAFVASRAQGTVRFFAASLPASGTLRTAAGVLVVAGTRYGLDSLPWRYTGGAAAGLDSFDVGAEDVRTASLPAKVTVRVIDSSNGYMERVSVSSTGGEVNLPADGLGPVDLGRASVCIDGQGIVVGFTTRAPLAPADLDDGFLRHDIYTHQRQLRTTHLHSGMIDGNQDAGRSALSADGQQVFYLAPVDGVVSLLRTHLATAEVDTIATFEHTSGAFAGQLGYAVSGDGSRVCYLADAQTGPTVGQLLLWQEDGSEPLPLGVASDGTPANAACLDPAMSIDGRVVAFVSAATNLAAGNETGDQALFVRYLDGEPGSGITVLASPTVGRGSLLEPRNPSLSRHGRFVSFIAGEPAAVYVRDLFTASTTAIADSEGALRQSLSADGRFVVFSRSDGTFVQVYRHDRLAGVAEPLALVSNAGDGVPGNQDSGAPVVSATGQFVAFPSLANNLIPVGLDSGVDLDVFINDFGPPANQLPAPTLTSLAAVEDTLLADIELTYMDAEGNDVAVELVAQPVHALAPLVIVPPGPGQPFPRVAYQAKANYFGADSFSYRVGDAHGWSAPQVVTIDIAEVNDPPVWIGLPAFAGPLPEGGSYELDLRAYVDDPDLANPPPHTDTLTFTVVAATAAGGQAAGEWIAVVDGHRLVVSPPYEVATFAEPLVAFEVTLEVADRELTVPLAAPMRIEIQNTDRPPVIESIAVQPVAPLTTDALVAEAVASDPDDGDDEALTIEYQWFWNGQSMAGLTGPTLAAAETLKGETWSVGTRALSRGLFSDWVVSAPRTVGNSPPLVIQAGVATGGENEAIIVDLGALVADPDVDDGVDEHGFEIIEAPDQGSFTVVGSLLTYRPAWDELAADELRQVDFRYRVSDGTASTEGTVAITVVGENDAPAVQVIQPLRLQPGQGQGQVSTAYGRASGQAPATTFGPGAVTVWDVDSPAAQVRLRVASLPGKGSLWIDDTELTVGHELVPGALLDYRADSDDEVGTDSFALAGWDGSDQTTPPTPVTILLGRFVATITLVNGWNAVALPLQPDEVDLATLLRNPQTGRPAYVGNAWQYRSAGGFYVPAHQAMAGEGVIVFCEGLPTEGLPVEVPGVAVEAAVDLDIGWHLRGGLGYGESAPVPAEIVDEHSGRGRVYQIDANGRLSLPTTLQRGRGMWFRMATPGVVNFTLDPPPIH